MDRSAGFRATDRRAARSIDPPHSHPGDERAKLSAEEQQEDEGIERITADGTVQRARERITCLCAGIGRVATFGGVFRVTLNAPPYGRRRVTLQPPPKAEDNGLKEE